VIEIEVADRHFGGQHLEARAHATDVPDLDVVIVGVELAMQGARSIVMRFEIDDTRADIGPLGSDGLDQARRSADTR